MDGVLWEMERALVGWLYKRVNRLIFTDIEKYSNGVYVKESLCTKWPNASVDTVRKGKYLKRDINGHN